MCSFVVLCGVLMYARSTAGLSKHMGSSSSSSGGDDDDDDDGKLKKRLSSHGDGDMIDQDGNSVMVEECPSSATKATGSLEKRTTFSSRASSVDSMIDNL
jgi:hypothetical protein